MDSAAVARIEEASLNATTVLEQQLYRGWLVRWAPSAAKRARSINILSPSAVALDERLEYVASVYERARLPLIFRLTHACPDPALEPELEKRGYQAYGRTLVMTVPLDDIESNDGASTHLRLYETDVETFAREVGKMKGASAPYVAEHAQRLAAIAVPKRPLLAYSDNVCVGAALAVLDDALVGVFDVIADATLRRQGIATALLRSQFQDAARRGARQAYLQVESGNDAAHRLYERFGFTHHHDYWYRSLGGEQTVQAH
jgi:ribosomal protein S18 acetylase RimI-like enzyme